MKYLGLFLTVAIFTAGNVFFTYSGLEYLIGPLALTAWGLKIHWPVILAGTFSVANAAIAVWSSLSERELPWWVTLIWVVSMGFNGYIISMSPFFIPVPVTSLIIGAVVYMSVTIALFLVYPAYLRKD